MTVISQCSRAVYVIVLSINYVTKLKFLMVHFTLICQGLRAIKLNSNRNQTNEKQNVAQRVGQRCFKALLLQSLELVFAILMIKKV